MSDPLPADLALALQTTRARRGHLGEPATFFLETTSTNDVAAVLAERGAAEGTTVIAAAQTSGRGRMGRTWHSPPDAGLYMSIVFRSPAAAPFLTLLGGVAVAEGIRAATGLPLEIKWPNDVVTARGQGPGRRRKIAGILAEGSSSNSLLQFVVLGIGINVRPAAYPPELVDRASSIEVELGRPVDTGAVLSEILASLAGGLPALIRGDSTALLARWRALAPSAQGAVVECETGAGRVEGIASGVADDGALLVRVGGTVERIVAGEVVWK